MVLRLRGIVLSVPQRASRTRARSVRSVPQALALPQMSSVAVAAPNKGCKEIAEKYGVSPRTLEREVAKARAVEAVREADPEAAETFKPTVAQARASWAFTRTDSSSSAVLVGLPRRDGGGTTPWWRSWPPTSLHERVIKTGARRSAGPGRDALFQLAEAAMPRTIFVAILGLITGLRGPPAVMEAHDRRIQYSSPSRRSGRRAAPANGPHGLESGRAARLRDHRVTQEPSRASRRPALLDNWG